MLVKRSTVGGGGSASGVTFLEYNGKKYILNNPYSGGGSLNLKGGLHTHSNESFDTTAHTPTAVLEHYRDDGGYDFMTLTDHDVVTADPVVSGITWIGASVEETGAVTATGANSGRHHLIAIDVTAEIETNNLQDVINFHKANDSLTSIAHCDWGGEYTLNEADITNLYGFNLIEVYNRAVDYFYPGPTPGQSMEDIWDMALSAGKKCFGVAVDDYHENELAFNYGWVVVHTDANTKAAIKGSLRSGNFYASTGNDITYALSGLALTATSTVLSNFTFIGRNGAILQTDNNVLSASYTILGGEYYVRVKSVKVSDSTIAWGQPVFLDYLGDDTENLAELREIIYPRFMGAQSIRNGNFEVWQRGASFSNPTSLDYTADKWKVIHAPSGGTWPTSIVHSQEIQDPNISPKRGMMEYGLYAYNIAFNGAGSSLGVASYYQLVQYIEHGTRFLASDGFQATLSFKARSDVTGKRLGVDVQQYYGTGGTPTAVQNIVGDNVTLSDYYVQYEIPIELNPRSWNIILGTNDDDHLAIKFWLAWGSTYQSRVGASTAETFVGAGDVDIINIMLNVGGKSIPFMPKPVPEELNDCQRYCYAPDSSDTNAAIGQGNAVSTTSAVIMIPMPVAMRIIPTLTATAADWQLSDGVTQTNVTSIAIDATRSNKNMVALTVGVASGLTQYRQYMLQCDGTANRLLLLEADI